MTQTPDSAAVSGECAPAAAPRSGPTGWVERRPGAAFAAFLALHFTVWTVLPTLLYANLPLDLIEALTYGREWPLGSDKLPPLPWWLVEIAYRAFGADAAYYALAEIAIVLAFVAVWATARPLVGGTGALAAVLIVDGLHYFQYTAVKFNHDVIQLPFWTLAGYAFHAALKRGRIGHWLALGVAFGGALWAKYFVIVLAAPFALFLLLDRNGRRALATPGPWLGAALALVIAGPHFVWLVKNDFAPLAYVDARSPLSRGWFDHILHPAAFLAGQLFFLLPALLIAAMFLWPRSAASAAPSGETDGRAVADPLDRRIVALLAFGPALAMLALIGASGRGAVTMWGYPLWCFLGLWIVMRVPAPPGATRLKLLLVGWSAVFAGLAVAFVINYTVLPGIDHRYRAEFFPGAALAAALTQRFHDATGGHALRYVIGSMWLGGNVAHYSPAHPQVVIDGLPRRSPWIDLAELHANGAVVVWNIGDLRHLPARLAAIAPDAQVGAPFVLHPRRFGTVDEHIGWAILKPRP